MLSLRPHLPAFGAAALAAIAVAMAYWAALAAGAVGGITNLNITFFSINDVMHPWLMYRGAFIDGEFPLNGYRTGVAPFFLPDLFGLFALYSLGLHPIIANMSMPIVIAAIAAGGWTAVCSTLYPLTSARIAIVLLLHALPFLVTAFGPTYVHALAFHLVSHYGTWSLMPWLLFLAIKILTGRRTAMWACILAVLLAFAVASDLVAVPWFVAPFAGILLLFAASNTGKFLTIKTAEKVASSRLATVAAALVSGSLGGLVLGKLSPLVPSRNVGAFIDLNLGNLAESALKLVNVMTTIAARSPASTVIWLLFCVIVLWRLILLFQPRASSASWHRDLLGLPSGIPQATVALYLPMAMVASAAALVATGNFGAVWGKNYPMSEFRYMLPLSLIPLYAGWQVLPWKLPAARNRAVWLATAASCLVMLIAAAIAIPKTSLLHRYNIFSTPFHECFSSAARRHGWKGGIGTASFNTIIADPTAGVERYLPVGIVRSQEAGKSLLYLDWNIQNRHWFSGDFQFVVVNGYRDTAWFEPPIYEEAFVCGYEQLSECVPSTLLALLMDESTAVKAFGQPQNVIDCEGVAFFHYDPPIRTNYGPDENPDLTRVGNSF